MKKSFQIRESKQPEPSFVEFIVILTLMMSITALSIDAMLPALPEIAADLQVANENDRQLVVSTIFLGIAFGQLFFGPLSDSIGRKPAVLLGYGLYLTGAVFSALAGSFTLMLAGRLIQGLGISAPRTITLAIVRDRYQGRLMARVMSFAMTVFILVPMIAPSLGQAILFFANWRAIFVSFIVIAALTATWFILRMPETLAPEKRIKFSLHSLLASTLVVIKDRSAITYTITAGLISGAFLGYLNSAQQIFQEQYGLGPRFPVIFAIISLAMGLASFLNARIVLKLGMRFLVHWSLILIFGLGAAALAFFIPLNGHPPLWALMSYIMLTFFGIGILFGNQNTLAMEPLGHLAGIGSAIVGSLSTLISMPLGTLIGRAYNNTVLPLVIGISVLAGISYLAVHWVERKSH